MTFPTLAGQNQPTLGYQPHKRNRIVASVILLFVPLIALTPLGVWLYPSFKMWSTFNTEQLHDYEDMLTEGSELVRPDSSPPLRMGKVVLVVPRVLRVGSTNRFATRQPMAQRDRRKEMEPASRHPAMYRLAPELRAGDPSEVQTVIFCELETVKLVDEESAATPDRVIRRESGASQQRTALLKAFDLKTGDFLGAYVVEGPETEVGALPEEPDLAPVIESMTKG